MNALGWVTYNNIKLRLSNKNEAYDWVLSDIETFEDMTKKLAEKSPPAGAAISDELYLQTAALNILIISQFEYLLKSLGKIKEQFEIKNIIKNSKVLGRLEREHLLYLFFVRHTIVHNGGHFDVKFFENIKKEIKTLKIDIPKDSNNLSPIELTSLGTYINLVKKIILLDIAGDLLSDDEKKIIEESLK